MKAVAFLLIFFHIIQDSRTQKFIDNLIEQAQDCAKRDLESGKAFFNQILDEIPWFDRRTRSSLKQKKMEAIQAK